MSMQILSEGKCAIDFDVIKIINFILMIFLMYLVNLLTKGISVLKPRKP